MRRIHTRWGAAIQEACRFSSVPPEFLAALIANESAGKPDAKRFERRVFPRLKQLRAGEISVYNKLRHQDVRGLDDSALHSFATSWGLTQIMGYHTFGRGGGLALIRGDPVVHLKFALGLLAEFAERYQLNLVADFEELFRCWNTGAPYDDPQTARIEGRTHDPRYVENGLARMEIYRQLAKPACAGKDEGRRTKD